MNYRRVYIPNSFVHIIITSYDRKPIFIDNINILRIPFWEFGNMEEIVKNKINELIKTSDGQVS